MERISKLEHLVSELRLIGIWDDGCADADVGLRAVSTDARRMRTSEILEEIRGLARDIAQRGLCRRGLRFGGLRMQPSRFHKST